MPSNKSNFLKQMSKINSYGFKRKKSIPISALEKHSISFENKKYFFSLSEIRSKISDLKNKHREVREKRLETLKYSKKLDIASLRKESLSIRLEISKFEV